MRQLDRRTTGIATLVLSLASSLRAQTPDGSAVAPVPVRLENRPLSEGGPGLSGAFGAALTDRLLRSSDIDERLQGLERAADAHTAEGLGLLLSFREEGERASGDPRVLLALVRGLSEWSDRPAARAKLGLIARDPAALLPALPSGTMRDPIESERLRGARLKLAREEAAMALASSKNASAQKLLFEIARDNEAARDAATRALIAFPPEAPSALPEVASTMATEMLSSLSDLRATPMLHGALDSRDTELRAAALEAAPGFDGALPIETARGWRHDSDGRIRVAATAILVGANDEHAAESVRDLIGDEKTAAEGLRLAATVQSEVVVRATAARAMASGNLTIRFAAIDALGHQASDSAVSALVSFATEPRLAGAVAQALAHSPSAAAMAAIEELAARQPNRRLAARAYFVRRYVRGERSQRLDVLIEELGRSSDPRDRAVFQQATVGFGERAFESAWADSDPRVRIASALGAMGRRDQATAAQFLRRLAIEPDQVVRVVLSWGLTRGPESLAPSSSALLETVSSGQPDAPLAAFVLGERETETTLGTQELLSSPNPLIRAQVLRGLGSSRAPDATARLALAYRWEADDDVRRVIVGALASREHDRALPAWGRVLDLAARLDPSASTRSAARRALAQLQPAQPPDIAEVAWIVLTAPENGNLPRGATGLLASTDGMLWPLAFDDDGFALIPGVPPGTAQLRLATLLPTYSADDP